TRLPAIEAKAEIDAVLRGGLHACERAARRDERHIRLARLDGDLAGSRRGVGDGIEDRPELRSIRVLAVNELVGGREKKIRIAEALHDQERLRVAGNPLLCQPGAQALLVIQTLSLDAPVPTVHVLAGPLLEEASGHLPHALPVTSLGHRTSFIAQPSNTPGRSVSVRILVPLCVEGVARNEVIAGPLPPRRCAPPSTASPPHSIAIRDLDMIFPRA